MNPPKSIPVPPRLATRPRWHDFPIPFIALIKPDGEPDFRVTDEGRRQYVIRARCCQLCGLPLGRFLFFTGGPSCAEHLTYWEPAAHLDCLLYAMQVCPFIAGSMDHAPIAAVQADNPTVKIKADSTYTTVKSEFWIIVKATRYEEMPVADGTAHLRLLGRTAATGKLLAEKMNAMHWLVVRNYLLSAEV